MRAVVLGASLCLACGGTVSERRLLSSGPPFESVTLHGRDLLCRLDARHSLGDAVDIRPFAGFRDDPGLDQLKAKLGAPMRSWQDRFGETWYAFRTDNGHLEAGTETSVSGPDRSTAWRVYAVPNDSKVGVFFDAAFGKFFEIVAQGYVTVVVETTSRSDAVVCEVNNSLVKRCRLSTGTGGIGAANSPR